MNNHEINRLVRNTEYVSELIAQNNIGVMHDNGGDVSHDRDATIKWYTLAAKQGHENAQYSLDAMH